MAKATDKFGYLGIWGNAREKYMIEHENGLYEELKKNGTLESYLDGYQKAYGRKYSEMLQQRMEAAGCNEELRRIAPFEYIEISERLAREVRATLMQPFNQEDSECECSSMKGIS